ncbi:hypothetical protein WA158_002310 [Blastocystis sp. Blastoise]
MQRLPIYIFGQTPMFARAFVTKVAPNATAAQPVTPVAAAAPKATTKKARKPRAKAPAKPKTDRKPSGLEKPIRLSPQLSSFMGINVASHIDVQKKTWAYIKANNLQNANNMREIICDPTLKALLGVDKVGMLQLTGLLSKHFEKSTPKSS